jgi:enoyl-CoA hydratase
MGSKRGGRNTPVPTENGLSVSVHDHVARVTLDRPDRPNALSEGPREDLVAAFNGFETDYQVWVVGLTGSGDRAFCAGLDLKELQEHGRTPAELLMRGQGRSVFDAVLECGQPVIAALNGWALGAGCSIACDMRLAADRAQLGMPEANRGLGTNFGSQVLPKLVSRRIAYEMLHTGEPITAELAESFVGNAPLSHWRRQRPVGPNPYDSQDHAEGVVAFLEKPAPR